jgi:predicted MFS family arabinose efflux permease
VRPGSPACPEPVGSEGLTLLALATAGLVVSVMQTLVLPLLPSLVVAFHTSVAAVTWVFTATLLAGAVATPLLSRLGAMYGKKPMLIVAMVLLVAGSVVCALTDSLGVLIAMLLTGVIAAHTTSFHIVFWVAAGAGVLGLILVVAWAPSSGGHAGGRPDVPGALSLAAWLVCLLIALSEGGIWGWRSGRIIGLFAAAVAACALWAWIETRVRDPLVRLPLLVGPRSLSANLASLLLGFAMFTGFFLVSDFVQTPRAHLGYGLSGSVLDVGLYLLPGTVASLGFSAVAGRFDARIGAAWTLAAGSVLIGAAFAWLAVANARSTTC